MSDVSALLDVFSASDIARAAGADVRDIRVLIESGRVPTVDGHFVAAGPAVEVVRSIRAGAPMLAAPPALFQPSAAERREAGVPLVGSVVAHAVMIGGFALMLGVGAATHEPAARIDKSNLVFLISPGPGGGGGGGGLQQRAPAARAAIRGISARRSPVRTERVVEPKAPEPEKPLPAAVPEPAPRVEEPPPAPPQPEPAPPVVAPVATVASDTRDRAGVPDRKRARSGQSRNGHWRRGRHGRRHRAGRGARQRHRPRVGRRHRRRPVSSGQRHHAAVAAARGEAGLHRGSTPARRERRRRARDCGAERRQRRRRCACCVGSVPDWISAPSTRSASGGSHRPGASARRSTSSLKWRSSSSCGKSAMTILFLLISLASLALAGGMADRRLADAA